MTPELEKFIDDRITLHMEAVAEAAAEKALQKIYAEVGRGLLVKFAWFIGVLIIALLSWMAGKGMKFPSP